MVINKIYRTCKNVIDFFSPTIIRSNKSFRSSTAIELLFNKYILSINELNSLRKIVRNFELNLASINQDITDLQCELEKLNRLSRQEGIWSSALNSSTNILFLKLHKISHYLGIISVPIGLLLNDNNAINIYRSKVNGEWQDLNNTITLNEDLPNDARNIFDLSFNISGLATKIDILFDYLSAWNEFFSSEDIASTFLGDLEGFLNSQDIMVHSYYNENTQTYNNYKIKINSVNGINLNSNGVITFNISFNIIDDSNNIITDNNANPIEYVGYYISDGDSQENDQFYYFSNNGNNFLRTIDNNFFTLGNIKSEILFPLIENFLQDKLNNSNLFIDQYHIVNDEHDQHEIHEDTNRNIVITDLVLQHFHLDDDPDHLQFYITFILEDPDGDYIRDDAGNISIYYGTFFGHDGDGGRRKLHYFPNTQEIPPNFFDIDQGSLHYNTEGDPNTNINNLHGRHIKAEGIDETGIFYINFTSNDQNSISLNWSDLKVEIIDEIKNELSTILTNEDLKVPYYQGAPFESDIHSAAFKNNSIVIQIDENGESEIDDENIIFTFEVTIDNDTDLEVEYNSNNNHYFQFTDLNLLFKEDLTFDENLSKEKLLFLLPQQPEDLFEFLEKYFSDSIDELNILRSDINTQMDVLKALETIFAISIKSFEHKLPEEFHMTCDVVDQENQDMNNITGDCYNNSHVG